VGGGTGFCVIFAEVLGVRLWGGGGGFGVMFFWFSLFEFIFRLLLFFVGF